MSAALVRIPAGYLCSLNAVLPHSDTVLKSNTKCNVELNAVPCSASATVWTTKVLTMATVQHTQYNEQGTKLN